MRKHLFLWQLAGLTFSAVLGTILHFLFDWSKSPAIAPIAAVNESTWEHMKLLFFPTFLFAIIQSRFFFKEFPNFWWVKLTGILTGLVLIPTLFYTFNGAFGKSPDWLNILFFFFALLLVFLLEFFLLRNDSLLLPLPALACAALCCIALLFGIFTFRPPKLPLFQDPVTNLYGIISLSH
jgi:hypothetical protein